MLPGTSVGVFTVDQPFRSYAVAKLEEETLSIARVAHANAHRISVGLQQLREIERNRPFLQKQHHHGKKNKERMRMRATAGGFWRLVTKSSMLPTGKHD